MVLRDKYAGDTQMQLPASAPAQKTASLANDQYNDMNALYDAIRDIGCGTLCGCRFPDHAEVMRHEADSGSDKCCREAASSTAEPLDTKQ
jgi:hypothetical protein